MKNEKNRTFFKEKTKAVSLLSDKFLTTKNKIEPFAMQKLVEIIKLSSYFIKCYQW
ncbi:hypothetical protein IM753_02255 [Moraxella sp. K127]|uniref:hypothetical protein n=1 Tax=Moraxella TaxID=475 RepID=UPI00187F26C7|nr:MULTISPECIES: hypothetical protein [Moraxella]MBE9578212.1 hypothetical protein [Moraxella sp. K1664]MBE9588111.1 hypothetical protein [Moraxella sp. K1630]MBE9589813.1 hypothetical protein [Moraxella sp. K127]MDH9218656.1 hypothetical protein [Moraxella lacunata]